MKMGFFRYPGGKSKIRNQIVNEINKNIIDRDIEYREPFFGGGSIGLSFLYSNTKIKKIWINDFDLGISSLWTSVMNYSNLLQRFIKKFKPSVEEFDQIKEELSLSKPVFKTDKEMVLYGFKKLVIHQISYSGLGIKSGGPLGGRNQKSKYKIDCRWFPEYMCKKIEDLSNRFSNFEIRNNCCTNLDFSDVISDNIYKSIIYLDPPYFIKGNEMYLHGFSEEDHERLSLLLRKTKHNWILSYDDCSEIREFYNWGNIKEIEEVKYTINSYKNKSTGERKTKKRVELLISSTDREVEGIFNNNRVENVFAKQNTGTKYCKTIL